MIESFRGPNRWLSNFHSCTVKIDGMTFPSSEHAYMSLKSDNPDWKLTCQDNSIKPAEIKKLGRRVKLTDPDWDNQRLYHMTRVVMAKFQQNPDLKEKLLATGNQMLIEGNDWGDTFWGQVDGNGANHLGNILMGVRTALRNGQESQSI